MTWLRCWKSTVFCTCIIVSSFTLFFLSFHRKSNEYSLMPPRKVPKHSIVFLKTHKCASSTVQNILLRYAISHNLTVVLPLFHDNPYLSKQKTFTRNITEAAPWSRLGYNILCHHTRFNKPEIAAIMPPDTIYVSIVRDPVSQFESMFEYANLAKFYNMTLNQYIWSTQGADYQKLLQRAGGNLGPNQMLFDFGMDPEDMQSEEKVVSFVERVSDQFDYVMITEFFDESLIILKDILNWNVNDVITVDKNVRLGEFKHQLSEEQVGLLRRWNFGDQILYEKSLKKHKMQVEKFGKEKMKNEIKILQNARKKWFDNCIQDTVTTKEDIKIWSDKVFWFKLNPKVKNQTCENLVKPELQLTNEIRQRQLVRALKTLQTNNDTVDEETKKIFKMWFVVNRLKKMVE